MKLTQIKWEYTSRPEKMVRKKTEGMRVITVYIPEIYIEVIDKLSYTSRSEAIRVAIKEFIDKELPIQKKAYAFSKGKEEVEIDGALWKIVGVAG